MRYHGGVRIVCPSCAAAYDVPETALAPGRAVRCGRCGTQWAPMPAKTRPPSDAPVLVPPSLVPSSLNPSGPVGWPAAESIAGPVVPLGKPATGAEAAGEPPRNPKVLRAARPAAETTVQRPRRSGTAPLIAWLASLVVLVALVFAAYAWRDRIMAAWPPSERLYAALGIAHATSSVGH